MQPFGEISSALFASTPPARLRTLALGHVIPPTSLLPIVLKSSAGGEELKFDFGSRSLPSRMDALGATLLSLCAEVPDGLVMFVPSFQYEEQLVARWQHTGLWSRLSSLKTPFREPRAAADLDECLKRYAAAIAANDGTAAAGAPRGAVLLSVVGGKMSEGINFSDGLGRCVLMAGMPCALRTRLGPTARARGPHASSSSPRSSSSSLHCRYANPRELTLVERMAYYDSAQGAGAGREYYTNLCMKAVNQSVGRAIRHRNDYAAIVLADARFAKAAVKERLPKWIAGGLRVPPTHADGIAAVRSFFGGRAEEQRRIEAARKGAE